MGIGKAGANILAKVEAVTIDSASEELLSGELMRGNSLIPREASMCPNLKLVVRDATHSSRRIDA